VVVHEEEVEVVVLADEEGGSVLVDVAVLVLEVVTLLY
jgi:hypothetical protein